MREIIRSFQGIAKDFSWPSWARCEVFEQARRMLAQVPRWASSAKVMAKQTKITIETESIFVLHGRTSIRAWCPQCGSEAEMVALESTAVVSNLGPEELTQWFASQELHHSQTADGSPLICLNSLLKRVRSTNR